jgi:hypothetical protein
MSIAQTWFGRAISIPGEGVLQVQSTLDRQIALRHRPRQEKPSIKMPAPPA